MPSLVRLNQSANWYTFHANIWVYPSPYLSSRLGGGPSTHMEIQVDAARRMHDFDQGDIIGHPHPHHNCSCGLTDHQQAHRQASSCVYLDRNGHCLRWLVLGGMAQGHQAG
jgi:hypothetical protein